MLYLVLESQIFLCTCSTVYHRHISECYEDFGTVDTVPKVINFLRYNMKCRGENVILRGIVHAVLGFPQHFMLYRGNLDCFSNSVVLYFIVIVTL